MSFPAIKDPDHPGGGGGCSFSEMEGHRIEVKKCPDGYLWYKIKIFGEEIEVDLNPARILIKHNDTTLEVKQNSVDIVGDTNILGDLAVDGDISVTGNISVTENIFVNSPRGQLNVGSVLDSLMEA